MRVPALVALVAVLLTSSLYFVAEADQVSYFQRWARVTTAPQLHHPTQVLTNTSCYRDPQSGQVACGNLFGQASTEDRTADRPFRPYSARYSTQARTTSTPTNRYVGGYQYLSASEKEAYRLRREGRTPSARIANLHPNTVWVIRRGQFESHPYWNGAGSKAPVDAYWAAQLARSNARNGSTSINDSATDTSGLDLSRYNPDQGIFIPHVRHVIAR